VPTSALIIVAAGSSTRFEGDKMAAEVEGRTLLEFTIGRVLGLVSQLVVVCSPRLLETIQVDGVDLVPGGPTRTASEIAGLDAVAPDAELIGIHDGARPLVSPRLIERLFARAAEVGGAIPVLALPMMEKKTLKPLNRAVAAQTPQVFRAGSLRLAYRLAERDGVHGQDTADIVSRYTALSMAAVMGDEDNIKVTYPRDLDTVRSWLRSSARSGEA
jgi:2-C-methyl-D-erythritol 4-phosphate cytidylyltransferase